MASLHLLADRLPIRRIKEISSLFAAPEDTLIFIGEATTNLIDSGLPEIAQEIHALKNDCDCRGITDLVGSNVNLIDDAEWVTLSAKATKIISW